MSTNNLFSNFSLIGVGCLLLALVIFTLFLHYRIWIRGGSLGKKFIWCATVDYLLFSEVIL